MPELHKYHFARPSHGACMVRYPKIGNNLFCLLTSPSCTSVPVAYNRSELTQVCKGRHLGDISKRDALQAALNLVLNGKTNEGVKQLDDLIGRELERYFVRKGVPPEDAEEMVWELFLRAVKPGSGYRGDAPAEHWINTCKKRMVID